MRIPIDRKLQKIVTGVGSTQLLTSVEVKRSASAPFEVQFLDDVTPVELGAAASGVMEVKTAGEYDSSPLAAALAWTKTGTGVDTLYTFSLNLVNDPLNTLLGIDALHAFSVVAATDLFTSVAHGLSSTNIIQFSSTATLPAPLLPNTNYYVIASGLTADDFKVSATLAGSAVNITTTGTGIHSFRRITNDVASVTLMAEIQWIDDGQTVKTQTFSFVLVNDVIREGDVPPSSLPLVQAYFAPEISSLADFKAVPTLAIQIGYLVQILIDIAGAATWYIYRLESGPVTESEPQHLEPDDYDLSTNDKHWNGAAAPPGSEGRAAGLAYKFNTSTAGAPGSGKLLLNNATVASATALNISELDDDGNTISALLATWDDSTSTIRGKLEIRDPATPTNFAIFNITGTITDAGAYDTFVIAYVTGAGTFTNGLAIHVSFAIKGDKGDTGATGSTGSTGSTGATGATGPGYTATSATSFAIGTGSKAFTTQTALAYTSGARVRIASSANTDNWMEGLVSAYSGSTLTVTVGLTNGTGTHTDWNINLAGEQGATGATGGTSYVTAGTIGAGTSGVDIDLTTNSMTVPRVLTGNTSFDLINPVNGKVTIVHIKQAAASSYTTSFPDVDVWVGTTGAEPTMSTGFNVIDAFTFWYDGVNLYGAWAPGE